MSAADEYVHHDSQIWPIFIYNTFRIIPQKNLNGFNHLNQIHALYP